jgi:hypothetical protein
VKKAAIFALVGLMLVGLVGLADDEVPTDADFTIPNDYDFSYTGDLDFPATPDVTAPGATGWFETNSLSITFSTNYNLTIGLQQGCFHNGSTNLDTQAGGTGMFASWVPQWTNVVGPTKYWVATKAFGPGVYSGDFSLRVKRSGYSDPAGTYQSLCFIQIYTE